MALIGLACLFTDEVSTPCNITTVDTHRIWQIEDIQKLGHPQSGTGLTYTEGFHAIQAIAR